jgi:hypothetical protein
MIALADLTVLVGVSAIVAAVATVVGAIFLGLFFSKGEPWGTLNDLASIVLMVAMLPVAIGLTSVQSAPMLPSNVVAAVGVVGMVGAAVAQGLLVARRRTYEELLPWTLGFGAVVGLWYLGVALLGISITDGHLLEALALSAGLGYIAMGYGFWRGNQLHPLSIAGGLVMLVASTTFLIVIGVKVMTGELELVLP